MIIVHSTIIPKFTIAIIFFVVHSSLQEEQMNPLLFKHNRPTYNWKRELPYQTTDYNFDLQTEEKEYCNQISTEFVQQFQSIPFNTGPISCSFTMYTGHGTCGMRIDFLDMRTAASTNKICYQDLIMILNHDNGDSFNTPFCGDLQGYSTVLKVRGYNKIQVLVVIQRPQSTWNIRLTQIKCESVELRATDACGFRNGRTSQYLSHLSRLQRVNSRWLTENTQEQDAIRIKSSYYWHASVITPSFQGENTKQLSKIVNGSPSSPNEFPWLALILLESELHCTGSLITHRWIVTAAHCTSSSGVQSPRITTFMVALGVHNRALKQEPGRILRDVSNIVRHPQYEGLHFDIALLKLNESVRYNHAVRPICLPQAGDGYLDSDVGIVAGWGSTIEAVNSDVLLSGEIPFVNASYCRYTWHKLGVEITDSIICAGLTGTTTCEGDSGSPLVVEQQGLYHIVGITSFGASPTCGSTLYPDVFTRVASYLDWIALALLDGDVKK